MQNVNKTTNPNEAGASLTLRRKFEGLAIATLASGLLLTSGAAFAQADTDGDSIADNVDNCVQVRNKGQGDRDNDGIGNACDLVDNRDRDNDGIFNTSDNCPTKKNTDQTDSDNDGIGDACDLDGDVDSDGDSIGDNSDNCPNDRNRNQRDHDNDGIGNACDLDFAMKKALKKGDSTRLTGAEIIAAINDEYDSTADVRNPVWDALYARNDGVNTDDTPTNINWHPTHDSAYFSSVDLSANVPFLVSTGNLRGNLHTAEALAIARQNGNGSRALIFGGSPFADLDQPRYQRHGTASGDMQALMENSLEWVLQTDPSVGTLNVVIAHTQGYYWFPYEQGTEGWFADHVENATLTARGTCEGAALAACLENADLLLIGTELTADEDEVAIIRAVENFQAAGGAVIVQHSDHFTRLSSQLMSNYGLAALSNTSQSREVSGGSTAELNEDADTGALYTMFSNLQDPNYLPGFEECVAARTWLVNQKWTDCNSDTFNTGFRLGAFELRDLLKNYDLSPTGLFDRDGLNLLKLYVLLGDKYRSAANDATVDAIDYPIATRLAAGDTDKPYLQAIFADVSVVYNRDSNLRQTDLGSLYCPEPMVQAGTCAANGYDYDAYQEDVARLNDVSHGDLARKTTEWTTTGYSAMPGEAVTLRRLDDSGINVQAKLFYQRVGTSRTFSATNRYTRPQYVESRYIPLPADGSEVTISSPWGGPIYLNIQGSDDIAGTAVEVELSGVVRHLAILDASDDAEVADFIAEVDQNPLPTVDIRGEGFEAHMRRDKLLGSLSATYTLATLLDEYRFDFIEPVYSLAGFKAPGKNMVETLSPSIRAICDANNWDCENDDDHTRAVTQHSNYDDHANCGGGCAGNPWDSGYNVEPLGWLEGHELGHNLQRKHFNIHYVGATEGLRNDWGNYANRSGEVSNNVFPYFMKWRKYRVEEARPYTAAESADTAREGHIQPLRMWAAMQSNVANLQKVIDGENRKVLIEYQRNADINGDGVADHCRILANYPVDETDAIADISWRTGGIYDNNGERFSFYQGIPPLLDDQVMADGTVLDNGFEYITLMYEVSRMINANGDDATEWNAMRNDIGFGLFPQRGAGTTWATLYNGSDIRYIPGNDVIVVALSYLSGIDFRPYFDMRGVRYSDLANQQVQAHVTSGHITRAVGDATVPHFMPVIHNRLPMANPADTPRAAIDGDADTVWTDANMPNGGWTPMGCPLD